MTAQPDEPHVGLVVEGAGDRSALPVVLRAHLQMRGEYRDVLGKPVPIHGRSNALKTGGVEGYVATAGYRPGCVGVLVVLDADEDCAALLGPSLLARASATVGVPVRVSLAEHDFEDWLFASAETLKLDLQFEKGTRGMTAIRSAVPGKYVKPTWQPRLAARMDLPVATGRSSSLARALARFDELVAGLPAP